VGGQCGGQCGGQWGGANAHDLTGFLRRAIDFLI
jgi:hypothetical protein